MLQSYKERREKYLKEKKSCNLDSHLAIKDINSSTMWVTRRMCLRWVMPAADMFLNVLIVLLSTSMGKYKCALVHTYTHPYTHKYRLYIYIQFISGVSQIIRIIFLVNNIIAPQYLWDAIVMLFTSQQQIYEMLKEKKERE